jgi:DNA primase
MQNGHISREQIDRIKRRVAIVAVVAERGLTLTRRGRTLFALCPFHEERSASFAVSADRGLFHCFGCGVSGDVIGFVMRYDRLSFPETVRLLAARVGAEGDDDADATRATWR